MKQLKDILRILFPFLATILLWRLSMPLWNPGGLAALIPIFYYSFIRPTHWFTPFAVLFCFLIDYKSDTVLFWTGLYCLFYALNGFQNIIDLTRQKNDGVLVFMVYFGVGAAAVALFGWTATGFVRAVWLFLWLCALYIPFAALAKRISDD